MVIIISEQESGDSGRTVASEDKLEPFRARPQDKEMVERANVATIAFTV